MFSHLQHAVIPQEIRPTSVIFCRRRHVKVSENSRISVKRTDFSVKVNLITLGVLYAVDYDSRVSASIIITVIVPCDDGIIISSKRNLDGVPLSGNPDFAD